MNGNDLHWIRTSIDHSQIYVAGNRLDDDPLRGRRSFHQSINPARDGGLISRIAKDGPLIAPAPGRPTEGESIGKKLRMRIRIIRIGSSHKLLLISGSVPVRIRRLNCVFTHLAKVLICPSRIRIQHVDVEYLACQRPTPVDHRDGDIRLARLPRRWSRHKLQRNIRSSSQRIADLRNASPVIC